MYIRKIGPVYVVSSSFNERHLVKQAGFWWHADDCLRDFCVACKYKIGKTWWTPNLDAVERLSGDAYLGPKAQEALDKDIKMTDKLSAASKHAEEVLGVKSR